jgi:acyl-CoA dehydrogenase
MGFSTATGAMMGIMDGPTEVHKVSVARQVLKGYQPSADQWPSEFGPRKLVSARRRFDQMVDGVDPDPGQRAAFDELVQRSAGDDETVKQMQAYLDATIGNL